MAQIMTDPADSGEFRCAQTVSGKRA